MARVGQTIEHPLGGERLTFLETAATTGGEYLKVRLEMAPGGSLPRPHTHPRAEERFEVVGGRVQIKTAGQTRVAEAGETVIVPRGASHVWGNPFDDPAAIAVTVNPALDLETFFETWFGLARDGKVNARTQMPSFFANGLGDARLPCRNRRTRIGWSRVARTRTCHGTSSSRTWVTLELPAVQHPRRSLAGPGRLDQRTGPHTSRASGAIRRTQSGVCLDIAIRGEMTPWRGSSAWGAAQRPRALTCTHRMDHGVRSPDWIYTWIAPAAGRVTA